MRTSDVGEIYQEAELARKLEDEASAWLKRRTARPTFSMRGVQVVRVPKRRAVPLTIELDVNRP